MRSASTCWQYAGTSGDEFILSRNRIIILIDSLDEHWSMLVIIRIHVASTPGQSMRCACRLTIKTVIIPRRDNALSCLAKETMDSELIKAAMLSHGMEPDMEDVLDGPRPPGHSALTSPLSTWK